MARIEGGKLTLEPAPMQLRDSLQQIARMFELQAPSKGIGFEAQIDPQVPELVRADEKRLRQILINLLGNAVKFTRQRPGGVSRALWARDGALRDRRHRPGHAARRAGPGVRALRAWLGGGPGRRLGGTGLGLTIAKMLTDLMGGEMTAHSQPGQGSSLPRASCSCPSCARCAVPAARSRRQRVGYEGPTRRILVVDNEEADRGLLVNVLSRWASSSGRRRRAKSAWRCCANSALNWRPDAIFMDLAMPGIDGWETLRRIRHEAIGPPALAIVSANAFDQGLDNDVGITPADFFTKPVRVNELLDWLGRALGLAWRSLAVAPGADRRWRWSRRAARHARRAAPAGAAGAGQPRLRARHRQAARPDRARVAGLRRIRRAHARDGARLPAGRDERRDRTRPGRPP